MVSTGGGAAFGSGGGDAADFALAVLGALDSAASDGDPTDADVAMSILKQLVNVLMGAVGITTWPASAAPGNGVSMAEALRQVYDDLVVVDAFHDVPAADNTLNAQINEVIGNKSDAAAAGAVTTTDTLVGYIKQLVAAIIVLDAFHDVPAADATANAQINEVVGNKSDASQETIGTTSSIVRYVKGILAKWLVPTTDSTGNVDIGDVIGSKADTSQQTLQSTSSLMRYVKGLLVKHVVPAADATANVDVSDVVGNKTDAAAAGAVSTTESLMAYLKQLVGDSEDTTKVGATQVAKTTIDLAQVAAAYTLFTGTTDDFILESIVIRLPNVDVSDDANITSIKIHTDDATEILFISTTDGAKANLTAEQQLGFTGVIYINTGTIIQLTIAGGAADAATVCEVVAIGRAVGDGGNLT